MAVSNSYPYPGFTNPYLRGKLPPVKTRLDKNMCAGRIFIFIILGVILLVFGLVSVGVYLNVNGSTSSSQYTEIMPLYITSGTVSTYSRCDYCFKMQVEFQMKFISTADSVANFFSEHLNCYSYLWHLTLALINMIGQL